MTKHSPSPAHAPAAELLQAYLEIVWRVVQQGGAEHADRQGARPHSLRGRFAIAVHIYESMGEQDRLVLHVEPQGFHVRRSSTHHRCKRHWVVSRRHLEDVLRQPHRYLKNPARLDLHWLV